MNNPKTTIGFYIVWDNDPDPKNFDNKALSESFDSQEEAEEKLKFRLKEGMWAKGFNYFIVEKVITTTRLKDFLKPHKF